jgi:hypothetical protein
MQWRDGVLVLLSLALGPALASLIAGLILAAVRDGSIAAFSFASWWSLLSLAYIVGWMPMTVAGAINAVISRYFGTTGRLLLALPVGALPVIFMLVLIAGNLQSLSIVDAAIFGLGGAFGSYLVVAIVELFGPRLRPRRAVGH